MKFLLLSVWYFYPLKLHSVTRLETDWLLGAKHIQAIEWLPHVSSASLSSRNIRTPQSITEFHVVSQASISSVMVTETIAAKLCLQGLLFVSDVQAVEKYMFHHFLCKSTSGTRSSYSSRNQYRCATKQPCPVSSCMGLVSSSPYFLIAHSSVSGMGQLDYRPFVDVSHNRCHRSVVAGFVSRIATRR